MTKSAAQEWFSAGELAEKRLPGVPSTIRGILNCAEAENWKDRVCEFRGPLARKRQGRGGGMEYHMALLPQVAQAKLIMATCERADATKPDRDEVWARWEQIPTSVRAKAEYRLGILEQIDGLIRKGIGVSDAVRLVVEKERRAGRQKGISESTVYGWRQMVAGVPRHDQLAYLAPGYQGRTVKSEIPEEAWEIYKGDWLRQSKPTHAHCHRNLQRLAADRGWTLPCWRTFARRIDAEIPYPVQVLFRQGENALNHTFPHADRDRSGLAPMQILNLDGHIWDCRVMWPDGKVTDRPVSLAVQDICTGKWLALRFDLTLNHHLVRLTLGDTFREFGLCDTLIMDNGRENSAKPISGGQYRPRWGKHPEEEPAGLLKTLGVKAVFATAYWGQAKPVERMFRNVAHDIAKRAEFEGAYTGHNPVSKPENYGSRAIPFAEFEAIVRREMAFYNAQEGRKGQGMNGRSFDQAFADGLARRPIKRLSAEQLRLCMLASKPVSMHPDSGAITIEGHRYWSPALGDLPRQKVTARFDPERMDLPIAVYDFSGKLVAEATRVAAGDFISHSAAKEKRRNLRDFTRAQKAAGAALKRLQAQDVAAHFMTPAPPETPVLEGNVVALVPQVARTADQVGKAAQDKAERDKKQKEFEAAQDRGIDVLWNAG